MAILDRKASIYEVPFDLPNEDQVLARVAVKTDRDGDQDIEILGVEAADESHSSLGTHGLTPDQIAYILREASNDAYAYLADRFENEGY